MTRFARTLVSFVAHGHARGLLLLLAWVLFLGVADPTPRFVGLPLASEHGPHAPGSPSTHRGNESYDLPEGVSVRGSVRASLGHFFHDAAAFVEPSDALASLVSVVSGLQRPLSFAGRTGPHLRC